MQTRTKLFCAAVLTAALMATVGAATSSAAPTKTASLSSGATLIHTVVGDYYGDPLNPIAPASSSSVTPMTCAIPAWQSTSFTTSIPSNWTTLDARSGPFQGCSVTGAWHTGDAFHVDKITYSGQKICYSSFPGSKASSVWYHTPRGWSWSGGTSDAVWNTSC